MAEEIAKREEVVEIEGIKVKRDQVDLIKRTIFVGASDDELRLFFYECARRGTHPMDRLIFPVVRKSDGERRVTFQTGIDYLRAAAEETGRYRGQAKPIFGKTIKQRYGDTEIDVPESVELTVNRKDPETGEIDPMTVEIFWKEYYPGDKLGFMWRDKPHLMLAKCAEAAALRKAFPRKLGGLYVNEEMERAETVPFGTGRPPIQEPQKKGNGKTATEQSQTTETQNLSVKTAILRVKEWPPKKEGGNPSYQVVGHLDGNETSFTTLKKEVFEVVKNEANTGMAFIIEYKNKVEGDRVYHNIVSITRADEPGPEDNAQ